MIDEKGAPVPRPVPHPVPRLRPQQGSRQPASRALEAVTYQRLRLEGVSQKGFQVGFSVNFR